MATTTSYYGKLDKPEFQGQILLTEHGRAKFVAKTKTVSISTKLGTAEFVKTSWRTGAPESVSGLVIACTGTVSGGKLVLTRATNSNLSGAHFWYTVVGY